MALVKTIGAEKLCDIVIYTIRKWAFIIERAIGYKRKRKLFKCVVALSLAVLVSSMIALHMSEKAYFVKNKPKVSHHAAAVATQVVHETTSHDLIAYVIPDHDAYDYFSLNESESAVYFSLTYENADIERLEELSNIITSDITNISKSDNTIGNLKKIDAESEGESLSLYIQNQGFMGFTGVDLVSSIFTPLIVAIVICFYAFTGRTPHLTGNTWRYMRGYVNFCHAMGVSNNMTVIIVLFVAC